MHINRYDLKYFLDDIFSNHTESNSINEQMIDDILINHKGVGNQASPPLKNSIERPRAAKREEGGRFSLSQQGHLYNNLISPQNLMDDKMNILPISSTKKITYNQLRDDAMTSMEPIMKGDYFQNFS